MFGLIGCGTMGGALLQGIINKKLVDKSRFIVFDLDPEKTGNLKEKFGVAVADSPLSLCSQARKIFFAVKPQDILKLLLQIRTALRPDHLLISLAAGLPINFFQEQLRQPLKIIRIMPNTPCLVGEGMCIICKSVAVSDAEMHAITTLMEALGKVVALEEKHFSAVTGLSGSGPAYVFLVIEALADGGVEMGLNRDAAQLLAAQTVLGAAKMVLETGEHPAVLKNRVTSPGGTTSAGLLALEEGALKASLIRAVIEAAQREKALSNPD
jgi:pyrroline-5-carboxylate reductase